MTTTTQTAVPSESDAKMIVEEAIHKRVVLVKRFPTGLMHYVYDVTTEGGEKFVARLTRPENHSYFTSALFWYTLLKEKHVPVPTIYFSEVDSTKFGFPVIIMQRLSGKDLGDVYQTLSIHQKKELAHQMSHIQHAISELPQGKGFGYAKDYDDPNLREKWVDVLYANLDRSSKRLQKVGIADEGLNNKVRNAVNGHSHYFSTIKPECFLDDTTTKNVIIDKHGKLSGIVDFDSMAFGDPLYTLGLTKTSLLLKGYNTDYTDLWEEERKVSVDQRHGIKIYTAIFGLDILSEMGQSFNQDAPIAIDNSNFNRLKSIIKSGLE